MRLATLTAMGLLPLLLSCGDSTEPDGPPAPPPGPNPSNSAQIIVEPGALLLVTQGETAPLAASVLDALGQPVQASVTWTSSDPAAVSISNDGVARAVTALGSAQITASAQGLISAPILVLVARTAPGTVIVADSLIVSGAPEPVDPAAAYKPGWQYRIRMRGPAPVSGAILLARGEAPLAGRVLATAADDGESVVTLELLPLRELFVELLVDESIPLEHAEVTLAPALRSAYRMERFPGGGIRLRPRAGRVVGSRPSIPAMNRSRTPLRGRSVVDFTLGPFECTAGGSAPSLELPEPSFDITPVLALEVVYRGGLERLIVSGTVTAESSIEPKFEAVYEGQLECDAELFTFTLPIGGPLAFFLGGQVPVGVGMELSAKLAVAEVGYKISANARATTSIGVNCPGGGACSLANGFDASHEGEFEFVAPDPSEQFRAELGAWAYASVQLALGSRWLRTLQFEAVDAKAGLEQGINLATAEGQIEDAEYASGFDLRSKLIAAPGEDLQALLDLLQISASAATLERIDTLDTSPAGTIGVEPDSIAPGDSVTFTLTLDPVTYLGLRSVDSVSVFWRQVSESDDTTYTPLPGPCEAVSAGNGQKDFTCKTAFDSSATGEQVLYGFAYPSLFSVPLPLPAELGPDAKATVTIGSSCSGLLGQWAERNSLTSIIDTASGGGNDATYQYMGTPLTYGNLGASITASSPEGDFDNSNSSIRLASIDYVVLQPEADSLLGELVELSVRISGGIAVDPPDNANGTSIAGATIGVLPVGGTGTGGERSWTVFAQNHESTETFDEVVVATVPLGVPIFLSAGARASATSSNAVDHSGSAQISYGEFEVRDQEGATVPLEAICAASGTEY